jgi:hypothetical protein
MMTKSSMGCGHCICYAHIPEGERHFTGSFLCGYPASGINYTFTRVPRIGKMA